MQCFQDAELLDAKAARTKLRLKVLNEVPIDT